MLSQLPMLHAPIILLREGTDTSQGVGMILSNIKACNAIVEIVKSTLGPRGMDKLIHGNKGVVITNDGAAVMDLLNISHPAAKILDDISKSQDAEAGDGTTSVVILAGEFLNGAQGLIEDGLAPQVIISGFQKACELALDRMDELEIDLSTMTAEQKKTVITRCSETTLNSKLLSSHKTFFSEMVYSAVSKLGPRCDKSLLGIKKIPGGSVTDSLLIDGVAFKKTFSYAGFEQQPKQFRNPKILLLNVELELKAEKENAEVRISNPDEYQNIINAEWSIFFKKLESCVKSGAQIVLSKQPIGDLGTQYFADNDVFCAGRVDESDMKRTLDAVGGMILSTVSVIPETALGTCGYFEEKQIGDERYNVFQQCPKAHTSTIILRGGAQQFIDEAERSLNDAIMIVRRALKTERIVGGGGAIEMELSAHVREYSRSIVGKHQLVVQAFAKAFEVIPRTLATNSALDATDILNRLRQLHARKTDATRWIGVDCLRMSDNKEDGVIDTFKHFIWEPSLVKKHAIASATEAACMILSVDEMVRNPKVNQEPNPITAPQGRGRGARM